MAMKNNRKKYVFQSLWLLMAIEYLIIFHNFINSIFDNFFEKHYYYIKRGIRFFGKPDPFNILKTGDGYTISTSMEYYNGINEFTLQGKEKHRFVDVIKEIDALIDEGTKVIYTSGNKKAIKILEKTEFALKSMLMQKLLATIKY